MKLKTIQRSFDRHVKTLRNVNNLLQSYDFEVAYSYATSTEQAALLRALENLDMRFLRDFVKTKLAPTEYECLSIRKLRQMGAYLRIPNYHILNKATLIEEIHLVVARVKERASVSKRLKEASERERV